MSQKQHSRRSSDMLTKSYLCITFPVGKLCTNKAGVNNNKTINKMSLHFSKTPNKEKLRRRGLYRQEETFMCVFEECHQGEDCTQSTSSVNTSQSLLKKHVLILH